MKSENTREQEGLTTLFELYKIADENHRFYVAKRFTIVSLYFPLMTVILSGVYFLSYSIYQVLICIFGLILTLFLYSLENRNWILSNICANNSKFLGKKINMNDNLHVQLLQSYHNELPVGSTYLDRFVRKLARSQHKAVSRLSVFLLCYWVILGVISILVILK